VLASAARVARDLGLAEDCVQDAFVQALVVWRRDGVPAKPGAWLTTVACRRVLELRRREGALARKLPLLVASEAGAAEPDEPTAFETMPDDRIRLIFTCCHPALAPDARVALTLRLVCGLESAEVARCFLVGRTTMQARITRAKKKIQQAGVPYAVPREQDLSERLTAVLDTIHLVYTAGHVATSGPDLVRDDLADRGLILARLVHELFPKDPETIGLLALLVLTQARRDARTDVEGRLVPLDRQDRARWDRALITEGTELLAQSLAGGPPGRYALMATVTALHDAAPTWQDTDWEQIVAVYDALWRRWPSPTVALNRAVAVGHHHGPAAGLALLEELRDEPSLAAYPYLYAGIGEFQRRLGRLDEARWSLDEAIQLVGNDAEAAHLSQLRRDLDTPG
jgi:RNA polymerase sigma-70 factor (ECF subfamily)